MKILAEENFPRPVIITLRSQGHDVPWARTDCAEKKDQPLLERAEAEGRILWTLDKDFWQIALQRPRGLKRSGVILFRVHPAIPKNISLLADAVTRSNLPWVGQLSIITSDGIEMIQA